jgi:hypothetical protein
VAHITSWPYEFVTLNQHPTYLNLWGYVQYSRALESRADLDDWAPTFLAGQFGEALMLGFAGTGASQDNSIVMQQIQQFIGHGPDGQAFFQRAFARAQHIVQSHPRSVRLVTETLIDRQILHRDDITNMLATLQEEPGASIRLRGRGPG